MKSTRRKVLGSGAALLASAASAQTPTPSGAQPADAQARVNLRAMIDGARISSMLHVVAKLRIADHLKAGPLTVKELAKRTSTHEDSLYRLLRTLAGLGVFEETDGPTFRLNEMGSFLVTSVPGSLRVTAEVAGEPWMWGPWGNLMHSVKTGEVAFDKLYGKHTWEWFAENPGPAELFNGFMDETTAAETRAVVAAYDFTNAHRVVDIGGGRGVLLAAILAANPKAHAVLFDLPHVIAEAKKTVDSRTAARMEFSPGDFFKAVPSGGDVYVLKNIIHDWNDEEAHKILAVVRRSMSGSSRLLLVEHIICEPNKPCYGKTSDMTMMVRNGGPNRTEKEYNDMLRKAGFKMLRVVPTAGPGIIEAAIL